MKNLRNFAAGAFVGLGIVSACEPQKPADNPVPVVVVDIPPAASAHESAEIKKMQSPTEGGPKPDDITTEINEYIYGLCALEEPYRQCELDELKSFYSLKYKLNPNLRKTCGDDPGPLNLCMEQTFETVFKGELEYDQYLVTKAHCRYLLQRCLVGKMAVIQRSP